MCLLMSSLHGKASRTLVEELGLQSESTCAALTAEPGNLDIKRHEHGNLFIRLQVCLLLELAIMT